MRYLRQSTATVVEVGPFVDDTDGKTLEEALTVASIDVQLMQPLDTAAVPPDRVTNGAFASDASWTKNSWTIAAGVADSAAAQSTDLSQTPAVAFVENVAYEITFDVVAQSAGTVTPKIGGTAGTARSTVATFTETIIAGAGALLEFDAAAFTGQIDNVVVKQVPIPITPAASGSANDMVLTQANTGTYWLELTANQVGIIGRHKLTAFISGALIAWEDFMVRDATVFDALDGSGGTFITTLDVGLLFEAAISTVNSQTSFDMDTPIITDDNWIGQEATLEDISTGDIWPTWIADVDQANDRLILNEAPPFTAVAGDKIRVMASQHLTYALNTYDPPTRAELTADTVALTELVPLRTSIATLATQVSFTLTAGSGDNNAYKSWIAIVTDFTDSTQKAIGVVGAYTGASLTITLDKDPAIFTMAAGDLIALIPPVAITAIANQALVGDGSATPFNV